MKAFLSKCLEAIKKAIAPISQQEAISQIIAANNRVREEDEQLQKKLNDLYQIAKETNEKSGPLSNKNIRPAYTHWYEGCFSVGDLIEINNCNPYFYPADAYLVTKDGSNKWNLVIGPNGHSEPVNDIAALIILEKVLVNSFVPQYRMADFYYGQIVPTNTSFSPTRGTHYWEITPYRRKYNVIKENVDIDDNSLRQVGYIALCGDQTVCISENSLIKTQHKVYASL